MRIVEGFLICGNLILPIDPVVTQLGHPFIKQVLLFNLKVEERTCTLALASLIWFISPFTFYCSKFVLYLQVVDVVFCVKVNALWFFLDGHDREAHINAALDLPFLNLEVWERRGTRLMLNEALLCFNSSVYFSSAAAPLEALCKSYSRFMSLIASLWGTVSLWSKDGCFWETQPSIRGVSSAVLLILTSAMHLLYLRMPLSREKYLCREKSVHSVSVSINSSICNIPDSESEVMAMRGHLWQILVNAWR